FSSVDSASPKLAFSMMRLQRGLLRSDTAAAGAGAGRDGSAFGLIFAVVFAVGAGGGADPGSVESGVAALAATPAGTGGVGSGLGAIAACESLAAFSDGGEAAACCGVVAGAVGSIVACLPVDAPGAVSLLTAKSEAAPSAMTAMTANSALRAVSPLGLDLAGLTLALALSAFGGAGTLTANWRASSAAGARSSLSFCSTAALGAT